MWDLATSPHLSCSTPNHGFSWAEVVVRGCKSGTSGDSSPPRLSLSNRYAVLADNNPAPPANASVSPPMAVRVGDDRVPPADVSVYPSRATQSTSTMPAPTLNLRWLKSQQQPNSAFLLPALDHLFTPAASERGCALTLRWASSFQASGDSPTQF